MAVVLPGAESRSRASPGTPRSFSSADDSDHFLRHAGQPGYVYVMRSDFHREHVYKVGYTTQDPDARRLELDTQASDAGDVSQFRLIAAKRVDSCLEAEQALFEAMPERRITALREYFHGGEEALQAAVSAITNSVVDGMHRPSCTLDGTHWERSPAMPWAHVVPCSVPTRPSLGGGWVYVLRNFWHREGLHKVVCSSRDIGAVLMRLNAVQKSATSQLGFYEVVAAKGVHSVPAARAQLKALLGEVRIDRGHHFVDAPLSELERRLGDLSEGRPNAESHSTAKDHRGARRASEPSKASPLTRSRPGGGSHEPTHVEATAPLFDPLRGDSIRTESIKAATRPSWQAWTVRCDACKALVPYFARMDEQVDVSCQDCSHNTRIRPGRHAL